MKISRTELIEEMLTLIDCYDVSTLELMAIEDYKLGLLSLDSESLFNEALEYGVIEKETVIFNDKVGWELVEEYESFFIYKDGVLLAQIYQGEHMAKDIFECFKQVFICH